MSDRNVDKQFIQAARGTPHSIDAEVAVLGALLLHSRLYEQIAQVLQPRDFFRGAHQVIYAAMVRLLDRPDGAVELVTLADELKKRGVLDSIGGKAYLASLVDGLPRSTNIVHYAEVVREKALYRSLMEAGLAIHQQAQDEEEPPSVLLAQADARLLALQRSGQGAMVDISAATSWLLEDLQHRVAHQGELTGVPTGFPTLDALTQGWQPGDVIVIAARPSMGKTAFVVNSIIEACRMGKQGALFSLEMRRSQIEYRILSGLSGVPLSQLLRGLVSTPDEFERIGQATSILEQCHLHIDDTPGRTVGDIRSECRRLKAEGGLDFVALDYIQLMEGSTGRRGATRNEELSDISRRLKKLAGELQVPFLVLSQLSRAGADRATQAPKLSDLRDSGAIEQDADLVCFLHRANHRAGGLTHFIIEKQRNGETGTIQLTLDRATTLFTDGGPEPEAENRAEKRGGDAEQTPEEAEDARMAAERKKWAQRRKRR